MEAQIAQRIVFLPFVPKVIGDIAYKSETFSPVIEQEFDFIGLHNFEAYQQELSFILPLLGHFLAIFAE